MSALRSRIIDKMDDILDLMDIKNRIFDEANDDEDFRPKIVECIKQIAELEATPPSQVRRTFERVEQNVRRLKQSIANPASEPSRSHRGSWSR